MRYEWDENKRQANLEKHGLDFDDAGLVFESADKLTLSCVTKTEQRWMDIANVDGNLLVLTCVYTVRAKAVRIISLRHASRKERELYGKNR